MIANSKFIHGLRKNLSNRLTKIGLGLGSVCLVYLLPSISLAGQPSTERAIVLVPGTFNSLVPSSNRFILGVPTARPYFSDTIFNLAKERFGHVYVVSEMAPLGQFERNGEIVLNEVRNWYHKEFPQGGVPITIIAHSAGGFYSLWADHLNQQLGVDEQLPIEKIFMIATPLHGVELADMVLGNWGLGESIANGLSRLPCVLDIRGLYELTTSHVADFMKKLRISTQARLFTISGSQRMAGFLENPFNARYLSLAFSSTKYLIGKPSDGVISNESSSSVGIAVPRVDGNASLIQELPDLHVRLDHLKQVLDYRILENFGVMDAWYVRNTQVDFYNKILDFQ